MQDFIQLCDSMENLKTTENWKNQDLNTHTVMAPFIWSWLSKTTLPQSYPSQGNFSLISLQNSTKCLQEGHELVSGGIQDNSLSRQGSPCRQDNFSSYGIEQFGSRGECHKMSRFRI